MKKHSFYTMISNREGTRAELQTGYSDGTFYYYKRFQTWYAIHPLIGLSITYGYTLKECAAKAHAPDLLNKVNAEIVKRGAELTTKFENAIIKLKEPMI